jgi:DNA-binding MarR family transcriptional regulator
MRAAELSHLTAKTAKRLGLTRATFSLIIYFVRQTVGKVNRWEGNAVTECIAASAGDIATGLIDVLPRLLRRLRADVWSISIEAPTSIEAPEGAAWQSLAELRGSNGQVALMSILVTQGRATMQDLAGQMAVTPATVTMMVKRLLAQGYVERKHDADDWRLVWVSPTQRGRQVIEFYNHERRASLQRRLAQLSQDECAALRAALPALRHLIEVGL